MAGFKTHITTSSILGVGYGAGALALYDMPLPACILAGGLCGLSGMLPDLDSDSGVPLRESIAFAAAVVPMLLADRFQRLGMAPESIVLIGGFVYLFIRFGLAKVLGRFTVHRGMFHSLPACLIAGELAFLISGHDDIHERYFLSSAVMLGFMSHLVLDEIWSIDFRHFRLKSSSGTAIKFWGDSLGANMLTYAGVFALTFMSLEDPVMMKHLTSPDGTGTPIASQSDDDQQGYDVSGGAHRMADQLYDRFTK